MSDRKITRERRMGEADGKGKQRRKELGLNGVNQFPCMYDFVQMNPTTTYNYNTLIKYLNN